MGCLQARRQPYCNIKTKNACNHRHHHRRRRRRLIYFAHKNVHGEHTSDTERLITVTESNVLWRAVRVTGRQ